MDSYYQQLCNLQLKIQVYRHKIVNYMIVGKTKNIFHCISHNHLECDEIQIFDCKLHNC